MPIILIIVMLITLCSCQKAEPVDTTALDSEAKTLVTQMADGDFEAAMQDHTYIAKLQLFFKATPLSAIWDIITDRYGDYVTIYATEGIAIDSDYAVVVKTAFANKCADITVSFNNKGQIIGIHQKVNTDNPQEHGAPEVQLPDGVTEREITFGDPEFPLPGVLTLPEGDGPFPAVILVHGSGPCDRDETVGKIKPFKDIAWALAQRGIAAFRYDKRAYIYPQAFAGEFTVYEETIADAASATKLMMEQPEVDPDHIIVVGHSLGGYLIPRIAAETPQASGYVMMAASVTPLQELMVEQYEYIFKLDDNFSVNEKLSLSSLEGMRDNVNKLEPGSTEEPKALFGLPASYWLDLKDYNPAEAAKAITKPLLVIQGEGDYQVPMREFEVIKSTLGEKANVIYKQYVNLSHTFTPAGDPPSPQDYDIEYHVATEVIEDLAHFVTQVE